MLPRDHYLKQAFQDLAHFPNGFEKGGLSDIQARLVRKNGTLISALCIDEVSDATSDDLHILKVIANQSAPKNPVEQAWIKYLSIVKNLENTSPAKGKSKAKPKAAIEEAVEPEPAPEPAKTSKAEPTKAAAKKEAPKAAAKPAKVETEDKAPAKAAKSKTPAKAEAPVKPAKKTTKA